MKIPIRLLAINAVAGLLAACHGSSNDAATNSLPPPALTGGLDRRPGNASCLAPSRSTGGTSIALDAVYQSLPFTQPLAMLQAPNDASRWFVLEKTGRVRVFSSDQNSSSFDINFIDLTSFTNLNSSGEGGLLGMAFHPDFASNGRVVLSWTEGSPMVSVVAAFTSSDGGQTLDPGTQSDVLRLNQDFTNHNGGHVAFGPDGYLYIGFGDGGSAGDPNSRAQDTTNLLGTLLRVDVDAATPYAIPPDNPFSGNMACPADPNISAGNCPEIFAFGLRNPWRWSFDTATGELWLGDVGQGQWEEIDRIERNGNYGWDCREGSNAFGSPAPSCSSASNLIDPVHEYSHALGNSVTGGYVYRGSAVPALIGQYLFADYGSGRVWRLIDNGAGGFTADELLDTTLSIASFGQGNDGELYLVDLNGALYRIVAGAGGIPIPNPVPALLSATGCVSALDPSRPASGLIPYDVTAAFWSDGANKERWLAVPDGTTITVGSDGDFSFPAGSVLMKHFRLQNMLIETRLMMRHPDGDWAGYSFEWNPQQTDATLVAGGKVESIAGQDWIFPSGNDCMRCHTAAAGFSLGLEAAQLNHDFTYPSTGRTANQLATLNAVAMFNTPLVDPSLLENLADPADTTASLDERARAYLHTNCSQCHRPGGPTPSALDLRFDTPLDQTNSCDAAPQSGDLGIGSGARIIAAGSPDDSVLLARMNRRDANAMPPLGSNLIDTDGAALIGDWIGALGSCP